MRKVLFITAALVVAAGATFGVFKIVHNNNEKKQEALKMSYQDQNIYFSAMVDTEGDDHKYKPLNPELINVDGIASSVYMNLAFFRKETGSSLMYDQVAEYLSREFEDDGEVRIYTNGRHPEIVAYMEWSQMHTGTKTDYRSLLKDIYLSYANEHDGFAVGELYSLPIEMIDELIMKEADNAYEMDLISIQERYIAEGRAKISEDGKEIEFISG